MKSLFKEEEKRNQSKERSEAEMLHRMAAYCSSAERCCQDVERKLMAAGLSDEVTGTILARLVEEKFIDEARFCRSFVNDKFRFNKWGRVKIGSELRKRAIPSVCVNESLDTIDENEYISILKSLLISKKKTVKGKTEREITRKLFSFALGRGFTTQEIYTVLPQIGYIDIDDEYTDYLE